MKQNLTKNKIYSNKGFSLVEMSIVLIIIILITVTIYVSKKVINAAYLSNAINLTSQAKFANDESLVLWLETSTLSNAKKEGEAANKWLDRSKNGILFFDTGSNVPIFKESEEFPGIKAVYFNGSANGYLTSSPTSSQTYLSFNLSRYTAFAVTNSEGVSTSRVYYGGPSLSHSELSGSKIVAVKNTGNSKYIKRGNTLSFVPIDSSTDNLNDSIYRHMFLYDKPQYFYIGDNSYKGEILEIIIFDRILSDKEVKEVEDYLYNKYMR